ncbi:hypothetical protein E2C01_065522 [Portunus trituberculatus]|uniref:Uncharacterized protein n=1 Tax=Portunus trituberculatus TaxID=210409 RepID=A0A5B7HFT0_PORTR|nr:hypothetical protein [Portunus trituberculatus]
MAHKDQRTRERSQAGNRGKRGGQDTTKERNREERSGLLASAGAHLTLTELGIQDVPGKTSRGTLVEPWLTELVKPLPEIR